MKKKYFSQIMGALLCSVMVLGAAGCSGQQAPVQEAEQSTANVQQESVQTGEAEASGEIEYPLKNAEKLSLWEMNQINQNPAYTNYAESPFCIGLAEKTGVEIEWQQPNQGSDPTQAYNLLLTEEVLPDIIFKPATTAEAEQLLADGVIYDLTEYLPVYAPDYWEYINRPENADILQGLKTDDGRFFNVGHFPEGDYNLTYVGPVIRRDWLEECDLDMPVTLADWEEVLKTFKEKYGAAFGFSQARFNNVGIGSGTGAYGTFSALMYVDDNGKVQLAQAQPEWKEYMETLHNWYEMGLIDKDSVAMDDSAMRTKALNNDIGVSYTAMSQISNWMLDAQAEGTGAEWVGMEHPRTAAGVPTCMIQTRTSRYYGVGAMITTSCPQDRMITALKWLNYGYTPEGMMYWNYGTEGVSYTLDENGEAQWTDLIKNDPSGISDAVSKYTGVSWTGITVQQAHFVQIKNTVNAAEAVYAWVENTEGPKHCVPQVAMTDEEAAEYSDKMTAIGTRVQEMGLKYMTGDESLDGFDGFVEELMQMGLQDCLDIMQDAYDRYMAK